MAEPHEPEKSDADFAEEDPATESTRFVSFARRVVGAGDVAPHLELPCSHTDKAVVEGRARHDTLGASATIERAL